MATIHEMLHAQHKLNERIATKLEKMTDKERLALAKDHPKEFEKLKSETLALKPNNAPKPKTRVEETPEENDNNSRVARRRNIIAELAEGEITQEQATAALKSLQRELETALQVAEGSAKEIAETAEVKIRAKFNEIGIPINIAEAAKAAAADPGMTAEKIPTGSLPAGDDYEDATANAAPGAPVTAPVALTWHP